MPGPVDLYSEIEYFDPVDQLTKSLSFHFTLDHDPSYAEIVSLTFNEALYVLDEYKFTQLGITAVGDLIDTDSINYTVGRFP